MELTSELQQSLEEAKSLTKEYEFAALNVPILWKAFLNTNQKVTLIYEQIEQNPEFLDKYVTKQLEKITKTELGETYDGFQMQDDLVQLLNHSEKIAALMGDETLSPEMVLIGIMDLPGEPIQQYLHKKNFTKADIIYAVQKIRGGKTNTQNSRAQNKTANNSSPKAQDLQKDFEESGIAAYGRDLGEAAANDELEPVIGREKEIRDLIRILSRKSKNNPLLIGEPGVGKSAIVEGLAQRISEDKVPDHIKNKQIFSLDMGSVVAGASLRGEFEERLKSILDVVKESEGEIILYIDEIHNIVSAGDSSGGMSAGNLLKPMLARGEVRTIGATTIDEYREHFEKDKALERRFQRIYVDEPSEDDTLTILRGLKESYEDHHGIVISDDALKAAVSLSSRYMNERQLPDKAIDLLDEASAMFHVAKLSHPAAIDKAEQEIKQLEMEISVAQSDLRTKNGRELEEQLKKQIDLQLEHDRLVENWEVEKELMRDLDDLRTAYKEAKVDYRNAEAQLDVERAQELKEDIIPTLSEDVAIMEEQLQTLSDNNQRLLPNAVSEEHIAEVVSLLTGIPANRLVEEDRERLVTLGENMKKSVMGQDEAIEKVEDAVIRAYAQVQDPAKPLGSFLFLGPTGVGKTELAKTLAENLFGSEEAMTRIDMSEYMEKHSVSRLVGAPPGYVGYDEGGQLTEAVRHNPYTIVLLDEIEKAHPDVFNVLLQVLDDGRITDASGRVVDFKNTIIIMTSNIGSNEMLDAMERDGELTQKTREIVNRLLKNNFRPEFLNRIDEILLFSPLTQEVIIKILAKMLDELNERLMGQDIEISIPQETQVWIAEQAYDPAFGARPLQRYIMREIETPLAHAIVSKRIEPGDTVIVEVQDDKLIFEHE